jgi:GNAT superfamily N-acetyltransferase
MTISLSFCFLDSLHDFDEIAKEHWDSFNNKKPEFDKEILSNFNIIRAVDTDNTTVGYLFYLCFKSPYYDEIWCQVDMFYIKKTHRKQGLGKRMFTALEEEARKTGASKILSSFNMQQPLEGFYNKMNYQQTHIAVVKEI